MREDKGKVVRAAGWDHRSSAATKEKKENETSV